MPRHVLIHPGFHKTGTSTLQRNLLSQAERLAPRLRVMVNDDVLEAARLARKFSVHPEEEILARFGQAFGQAMEALGQDDARPVLLSSEALLGQLPGRKGVNGYDAAPPLLHRMVSTLRERLGGAVPVTVWFTTREPEAWKRSAYYQNLRQIRLRQTYKAHARRLERASKLDLFVEDTRAVLEGLAEVRATRIEACAGHRMGPLGAALDILGVESGDLEPVRAHNVQPKDAAERLLALNRSELSDEALAEAKRALLREFRSAGETNQL